jgi:hypothetical protein
MTRKEIHNSRLVTEANHSALHFYTRRHFLRESAMGLGALALGSLIGCRPGSSSNFSNIPFDRLTPRSKTATFPGKARSVIYTHGWCTFAVGIIRL